MPHEARPSGVLALVFLMAAVGECAIAATVIACIGSSAPVAAAAPTSAGIVPCHATATITRGGKPLYSGVCVQAIRYTGGRLTVALR